MSDSTWDIYLLGEPLPGIDRPTLVRNLAALFKKDVPVIEKMLRKSHSLVKANVDVVTAKKYQAAIHKAGGRSELLTHGEQLFPAAALSPVAARQPLSVAPIETTANLTVAPLETNEHIHHSPYDAPQTESQEPSHFCVKCGAALYPGMTHCPKCYVAQPRYSSKSKVAAGFLAFFLGGFGIHRFYLGQWWGVFYLLFALTAIPGLIAFIEAFVFWFTPRERWEHKYGQVAAGGAGMVIAFVVGAIFFVAFIGILAAIALPAYQDYSTRAKVTTATPFINQTLASVEKVILEKNFLPSENVMAGLPENISNQQVRSIRLGDDAQVIVTFNAVAAGNSAPTIIWAPTRDGDDITWDCTGGTMPDRLRTSQCRSGSAIPSIKQ
ncbi:MAG TPA: NINE protein [Cellvibrio sp.]|nr:NINE protein [Cellvibrio sp.]